ncbi:unnamed protein product [Timema podura]|uniref:26S proteasome non-ATPase regulatory subunit 4 n=1 Tax=Timema podura TaxID=61482 RepID=A0ABN7NUT7_TIMPD|nr:unnamed protein product [Timema podura]
MMKTSGKEPITQILITKPRNSWKAEIMAILGQEQLPKVTSGSEFSKKKTQTLVDNSDYMRNGDFLPTRLQAQQDAVNLVCHSKTRANPENNVGLLTLANVEVLATLTSDVGRILSKLHQVEPNGNINLVTGIRIAHRNVEFIGSVHTFVCKENVKPFRKNHPQYTRTRSNLNLPIIGSLVYCKSNTLDHVATELALKHRQGKNHKMRIVIFVGSPVETEEKELVKLAKRLKKEKVNVDVVSFGEEVSPQGEDGMGGAGLGGSGFEFGVDPNEDPELALALRVSMEEQRQRQEEEARRAQVASATEGGTPAPEPIKEGIRGDEKLVC